MFERWVEGGLLSLLQEKGVGSIAFSPLAGGQLTDRYLNGIPEGSRAARAGSFDKKHLNDEVLGRVRALAEIAAQRGQSLAQLALAWVLRDERVTSALIGASSVTQLENSLGALQNLEFSDDELKAIDKHAVEGGINLWSGPGTA